MELLKWQSVIVEWVNCLNLSKPVQTVGDLKNEEFFRKLLLFITQDHNESLDRSVEDVSLTDFLKKHYPAYSLEVEPTLIQDEVEICYICSLLLHYCCFIDGRQELTAPLCKELNTTYQFHIKSFLEDLQESNAITRDLLNDAISNSSKYLTPTKTPFDSPKLVGNTPLVDFLKTPLKKQQVYDSHKKEIKQLQAQLDLERFEKADLQEEVNIQYEKNTKLDKIILNKQSEISRLRSELLALESRTPPSNTKTDGRLENKRLRDEVASLEKYVEILHKEQEEVQNERDKAREKLRKVEETCNDWQSRALNSERQCSKISEENEFQRDELIQLREKCEELSSILKEINAKNVCDESYEIDHTHADFIHNRSGSIDYDSLAHTVVDVQLIDAQEENKDLRKQLGELEVNTTELSTQMNQLQSEISKIMEENKNLVDNNKIFSQMILDSENQVEKCRHTLKQTEEEKAKLNDCIEELKKKLSETEFNLTYYENESESIANNLISAKEINDNLNEQLSQKIKVFNLLLSEKSKLHSHLDESTQQLLHFKAENATLKEFFDKFNKVFDNCLTKFGTELKEYTGIPGNDSISKLQNLVRSLENKTKNDTKQINQLQENCKSLSYQNSGLQGEVSTLFKENKLLKELMEKFNKVFETCLIKFERELKHYTDGALTGSDNVSKLQNLVTVLENKIKEDAQTFKLLQQNSGSLLERITNLEEEITTLYNNELESQKVKSNLKISLKESKSKILQLDEEIETNNKLILICKSTIEEKSSEIFSLKDVITSKDKFIQDIDNEKNVLSSSLESMEKKLSEEKRGKDLAERKINILMITLQEAETKLLHFEEDVANHNKLIETYKSTIKDKFSEISSLKEVIVNKDKFIKDLEQEKCELSSCLKTVESNLSEEKQLKEIINNETATKIQKLESLIKEKSKEICELKDILTTKDKSIADLNNKKSALTIRLESTENILLEEKDAKEIAEAEIENLKSSLHEVESTTQDLRVVIDTNNKLIETYKSIVEQKSKEFNNVVAAKDKFIKDFDEEKCDLASSLLKEKTEVNNLKISLQEVETKLQDLIITIDDNNKLVESYKSAIETKSTEFNNVVAFKDKLIEDLNNEKCNLASTLEIIENKLLEEKHVKEVAQNEISNLKSILHEVEAKIDNKNKLIKEKFNEMNSIVASKDKFIEDLDKEKCDLASTLETVQNKLFTLNHAKELVEKDCHKIKHDLIEKENCIEILETQKTELENNIESLNKKILTEKNNNTQLEEKCTKLQTIITDAKQQMQVLQNDKSKLNHQLENIQQEIDAIHQNLIQVQTNNKDLSKSVAEKDNHLQNLEKQKQNLNGKIEKLEKELKNAEKSMEVLKVNLEEMTKSLEEKSNHISNLELEKSGLQTRVANLESQLLEKTKQKDKIEAQLKDLSNSLNQKETCIKSLENDKNTIEQQIEILNNNLTSQELDLSNKITEQIKRNHELQTEIDIFNQNFSMINIEVSTIVNMLKTEEDIHIVLEQIHTGDTFGELSKTISNLKNNICSLIFEKRRLDNETSTLQQHISDLEHLKSSMEENHSESKKKTEDLTEQCRVLQLDKERYKSHMETYRKKLDVVQKDLEKTVSNAERLLSEHHKNMSKLQDEINDLKEEVKQYKIQESNMTTDLLIIKTELKETIINYQHTLQCQEDFKHQHDKLQTEYLQLSEDKTALALKLEQVSDDCSTLKSSHEDVKNNLTSHEKIVQELEEQIKLKDELVAEQEQKIIELNTKISEFIQEVQVLNEEKNKFVSQLSDLSSTVNRLEQTRKELEQKILNAEESMKNMEADYTNKIEVMDKERLEELERLLTSEKNTIESLTKQLADCSSDKNNLTTLCKESHNKIHSIYTIVFENKENKEMIEQINKLEQQEKQLESFSDEIVGREYDFIVNEITVLKKTLKELSNYETLKKDYVTLKNKYDHLSTCETENNVLKTELSGIETKLSDLHLENARYQKQISEKEIDHKTTKSRYEEELDLMKATCANWQKIIQENETDHKKLQNDHQNLKEKYDSEFEVVQQSNTKLEEIVLELEHQIKQNNNVITEQETKYEDLKNKYATAMDKISSLDPEILNLQDKINNYKKVITDLENDNIKLTKNLNDLSEQHKIFTEKCKQEHAQNDKDEILKLRSAYSDLMTENSRWQLDCTVLKKTVEDRNNQLSNLTLIKDSYEKLLEDNNKVNMELDTLRYKRNRDKEEFKRVIEESNAKSDQQIQEVKTEYEEKLKKMKEKIVKLYREEVEKEKKKVCTLQQEQAEETISTLKSQLWMTGNKYVDLKKENEKLREQLLRAKDHNQLEILEISRGSDIHSSRESVCSLRERRPAREIDERRTSTLPRDMKASYAPQPQQIDIIEECVTISRKRRSITAIPKNLDHGLKMEDEEGEFFNNTYLADLKAGRCVVSDRDSISSNSSRLSELQFRNSLCPPHLKSSYPAETQFTSPGQCKEDDIKMGTVDLDDSMSSSLLPGEKPRTKKDWGQTLYKKPGPPTPSKNGGRLSLQGNEVHPREVLREHNPGRTTSTPSRIKALFSRSGTSRDTENVSSTPRGPTKRRSIFRR